MAGKPVSEVHEELGAALSKPAVGRMRVAHVLSWISRNAGGLFPAVCGLARATSALDGVHVEIFGSHDSFTEADRQVWHPLEVHTTPAWGPSRLCYTPTMRRMIGKCAPDVVHSSAVWTYQAAVVNQFRARTGVPYVLSIHGALNPHALLKSQNKKAIARLLYQDRHFRDASCIHALTDSELASIRAFGLKNPVCVIPNGVELEDLTPGNFDVMKPLPMIGRRKAQGRKILLYLGRIHPGKGLVALIHAWAEAQKRRRSDSRDWLLVIAGWDDGGHQAELLQLCDAIGLSVCRVPNASAGQSAPSVMQGTDGEASVVFLGPQYGEEKRACYRHSDACILPSFTEGLPMSVLEAWSYAKPVLMTPQCNLPEGFAAGAAIRIVQDTHNAETGVRSIAAGLQELFDAPNSLLRTLGDNGRQLVVEKFTWPEIARQMKSVYDWVLGVVTRRRACVLLTS